MQLPWSKPGTRSQRVELVPEETLGVCYLWLHHTGENAVSKDTLNNQIGISGGNITTGFNMNNFLRDGNTLMIIKMFFMQACTPVPETFTYLLSFIFVN